MCSSDLATYVCPATGQSWTGKGMKPAWVRAALARGVSLDQLLAQKPAAAPDDEPKGKTSQKVEAGFAGGRASAGADLFEAAEVAA